MLSLSSILKGCIISELVADAVSLMILGQVVTGLNQFWTMLVLYEWRAWQAKREMRGESSLPLEYVS